MPDMEVTLQGNVLSNSGNLAVPRRGTPSVTEALGPPIRDFVLVELSSSQELAGVARVAILFCNSTRLSYFQCMHAAVSGVSSASSASA